MTFRLTAAVLATGISLTLPGRAEDPGVLSKEFLYESAPFPSCHASTLVETTDGGLVAAWFGGTHEKAPDVKIWLARREDGKWSAPEMVAQDESGKPAGATLPCWNPVLFQPKGAPLVLFYKLGPDPETWWGMRRTSEDGGRTWGEPVRLPDGYLGPIKNKPVTLADGTVVCPSSTESPTDPSAWRLKFEYSRPPWDTWTSAVPASAGAPVLDAIQPSVLLHAGGRAQAVGRTRQGHVFEVWSADGGKTWGEVKATTLPNPSSGTDAVTLQDGRQLIVYNHTAAKKTRTPLNVAVSADGIAWQAAAVLENEPGEYSYPAVIQTADGMVHITWTWHRKRIRHAVLDPAKLVLRPIVDGKWPE